MGTKIRTIIMVKTFSVRIEVGGDGHNYLIRESNMISWITLIQGLDMRGVFRFGFSFGGRESRTCGVSCFLRVGRFGGDVCLVWSRFRDRIFLFLCFLGFLRGLVLLLWMVQLSCASCCSSFVLPPYLLL